MKSLKCYNKWGYEISVHTDNKIWKATDYRCVAYKSISKKYETMQDAERELLKRAIRNGWRIEEL